MENLQVERGRTGEFFRNYSFPAYSVPAFSVSEYFVIVHSCFFHSITFVLHFPFYAFSTTAFLSFIFHFLHFPIITSCPSFSFLAFSTPLKFFVRIGRFLHFQ